MWQNNDPKILLTCQNHVAEDVTDQIEAHSGYVFMGVKKMAGKTGLCWNGNEIGMATDRPAPQNGVDNATPHSANPNSGNCH